MAKKKGKQGEGETVAGYFRKLHKESPGMFAERSNDKLLQRWLADHPDVKEVPKNVKTSLANIKSVLRSKKRKKVAKKQEGQVVGSGVTKKVATKPTGSSALERLEYQIDECLILARTMDREGLADVIGHLRQARAAVVWKIGL